MAICLQPVLRFSSCWRSRTRRYWERILFLFSDRFVCCMQIELRRLNIQRVTSGDGLRILQCQHRFRWFPLGLWRELYTSRLSNCGKSIFIGLYFYFLAPTWSSAACSRWDPLRRLCRPFWHQPILRTRVESPLTLIAFDNHNQHGRHRFGISSEGCIIAPATKSH